MKNIKEAQMEGKRILMRAGFDVGIDERGEIVDDTRIREAMPTIKYILEQKPERLVIISHLDRPEGKVVKELKLDKVAERLRMLLKISNQKSSRRKDRDPASRRASGQISNEISQPEAGQSVAENNKITQLLSYSITDDIILLENIRFYPKEEKNDPEFAKELAGLGELFVFEAFSAAHRAHASTTGVVNYLPSYTGLEMEKEVKELSKLLGEVDRPYVVIIGGAKTEDKAPVIENLKYKADKILVGGRTSNLLSQENKYQDEAKIELAIDGLDKNYRVITAEEDPLAILDIGPKTIKLFKNEIEKAKTILLAGPLGKFEEKEFANGTREIYTAVASSVAYKVAAGGDTIEAINQFALKDKFNFISTGGGATLEFLANETLPVIEKLNSE